MNVILRVKKLNLFYNYGKKHALFDISLDIFEQNVIAIIGPSGCGKSSFLRCFNRMNDLIEGTEVVGEMYFGGVNIYENNTKANEEDIKKLNNLKKQLLEYAISKKKISKVIIKKKKNSKEIKKDLKKRLDKIIKQDKKELNDLETTFVKELKEIKLKLICKNKEDRIINYLSSFIFLSKVVERFYKFNQNSLIERIELKKKLKSLKTNYKNNKRKIHNHTKRKTMELENYVQESINKEINKIIKANFQQKDLKYNILYNEYENQYRKVKGWKPSEVRTKIGLVFQKPNPFNKSIFENIAFGLYSYGITDPWIVYTAVEKSLRDAALWNEVKDRLNDSALSLSIGQQQRLCIARAISLKPKILLMDEPTASLDPISTRKIEELVSELKKKYTIIIVTHSMQQAARISDYTAFFYEGKLIEYAKTHDIFKNPKFQKTKEYIQGSFG